MVNHYNLLQKISSQHYINCNCCNRRRGIIIHHQDKNRDNNSLNNLKIVCRVCHKKIHHLNYEIYYSYKTQKEKLIESIIKLKKILKPKDRLGIDFIIFNLKELLKWSDSDGK